MQLFSYNEKAVCRSGGIGRRLGLKIQWVFDTRAGSSPASGTENVWSSPDLSGRFVKPDRILKLPYDKWTRGGAVW